MVTEGRRQFGGLEGPGRFSVGAWKEPGCHRPGQEPVQDTERDTSERGTVSPVGTVKLCTWQRSQAVKYEGKRTVPPDLG